MPNPIRQNETEPAHDRFEPLAPRRSIEERGADGFDEDEDRETVASPADDDDGCLLEPSGD